MATLGFPGLPTRRRLPIVALAAPPFRMIVPLLTAEVVAGTVEASVNQVLRAVAPGTTTASPPALHVRKAGFGECETIITSFYPHLPPVLILKAKAGAQTTFEAVPHARERQPYQCHCTDRPCRSG